MPTPYTPADSLLASAAILRDAGRDFDADFTQALAADAAIMPGLYAWHANEQAKRAARFAALARVGTGR
jgi:hypothetical protein